MRKRKNRLALYLAGAGASCLSLASCNLDLYTDQEPEDFYITRVTFLDADRESQGFTDLSVPNECPPGSTCENSAFKNNFSLAKSPLHTESGGAIRVVFNKLPLFFNGEELEDADNEPGKKPTTKITLNEKAKDVVKLTCKDAGCPQPETELSVSLTGSDLSPDPVAFPYGPAIELTVNGALEPAATYELTVDTKLQGRNKKNLDPAKSLGKSNVFTIKITEPLRVIRYGIGDDDGDTWIPHIPVDAPTPSPLAEAPKVANDGVVRLRFSGPVDSGTVESLKIDAKVGGMPVDAIATITTVTEDPKTKMPVCDTGDGRSVFIAPKSGSWGASGALTITVSGGPIKSASGRLSAASTYTVNAELSGKNVDAKYHGIAAADVVLSTDPVCKPAPAADMSMAPADMATPNG